MWVRIGEAVARFSDAVVLQCISMHRCMPMDRDWVMCIRPLVSAGISFLVYLRANPVSFALLHVAATHSVARGASALGNYDTYNYSNKSSPVDYNYSHILLRVQRRSGSPSGFFMDGPVCSVDCESLGKRDCIGTKSLPIDFVRRGGSRRLFSGNSSSSIWRCRGALRR